MTYGYEIRWVNHGYGSDKRFATIDDALRHAREVGFEAAIDRSDGGGCVATWNPVYGIRRYDRQASCAEEVSS